ncbi:hypothetical protein ACIQLJ_00395 [Microbacterium sp. NPDC091313]
MEWDRIRLELHTVESFAAEGMSRAEIGRRCESGELLKLHPGRWVHAARFARLHPEQRHLLRIAAVSDASRGSRSVFSHVSAAALHDLPVPRHPLDKVHRSGLTLRGTTAASGLVATHDVEVPEGDVCLIDGLRVTSLPRTILDVARSCRPETALSVADAAFRRVAAGRRTYDEEAAERLRRELEVRILDLAGGRGVVAARRIVALADGRADRPGESITRLYLARLGFRDLRLQSPVPGPHGTVYACDIGVEEVPAFVEFDGVGKYVDESMTAGRSPREIVAAEKEREDWIRAVTGRPVVRVMWPDIASPASLAAILRRHGIRSPR